MPTPPLPPETPDTRKARQFAMLHAMAERAYTLACNASDDALREDEATRSATPPARPNRAREHRLDFCRLSSAVRQVIGLEIHLEDLHRSRPESRPENHPANRPPAPRLTDPRRPLLRRAFHDAVATDPDRVRRRREIDTEIDLHLAADPARALPLSEIVAALCNDLAIDLDITRVPDAFLDMPPRFPNPPARASP